MTPRLAYLDTSAYVKLPLEEAGHEQLRIELSQWEGYVSSMLLGVEAIRACARKCPQGARDAREWLEGVSLLPLDDPVLDLATTLLPPTLRTLDALHIATALSVRDEIGAFFTYDRRLAESAAVHGLPVQPAVG
ncbi:MAG TPA: type II toxin-antitoxin system VapC family toxin [Solirubrobacterales bacterium]|nr:type II toxin-antitoxin system VapC family toxin [Solirubrobacterales bacterium]